MKNTDYIGLELYESKDNPDLINGYNVSMEIIDNAIENEIQAREDSDKKITSAQVLANGTLKVN